MIVVKLFGGLGNQMFIYAASKGIAHVSNQKLYFDIKTGFRDDYKFERTFALAEFNLDINEASRFSSFQYPFGCILRKISRMLKLCIPCVNIRFLSESTPFHYQPDIEKLATLHSLYLEGYFQSYKYFDVIRESLLEDFKIPHHIMKSVQEEADFIINSPFVPIAIGVRRYSEMKGDYGDLKVLNFEYYDKSVRYITEIIPNPIFIVFSEDIDWAKDNLKLDYPMYFVSLKSGMYSPYQDIYLMTLCAHHIISNSTFYWWGAYLANNKEHIVVAPSIFLNKDCVPSAWVVM